MIAEPKNEKTLTRIATALETSFVFKGIEANVLQQVCAANLEPSASSFAPFHSWDKSLVDDRQSDYHRPADLAHVLQLTVM